jgi:deazaflavin-dependent oxidoreductase (nitroreductase family)
MSANDWNQQIIDEFHANEGRVGGIFEGTPLLLLHHTGAKSGETRVNPLAYRSDNGNYVIYASKAGADTNPAWYHNLKANPQASIEVGTDQFDVIASEAEGDERDRLYNAQAEAHPQFGGYQEKTTRIIPVILLTPSAD